MGLLYQKRRLKANKMRRQISANRAILQRLRVLLSFVMIIGIISTFAIGTLLYLMKGKVGLHPEEYSKEDLKYSHLNKEKLLGDGKK